jgi:hypothetical protein
MGALLEGRTHLESSVFHSHNHNLPFVVFLALFNLILPHILHHFKTMMPILTLYIKLFKVFFISKFHEILVLEKGFFEDFEFLFWM